MAGTNKAIKAQRIDSVRFNSKKSFCADQDSFIDKNFQYNQ